MARDARAHTSIGQALARARWRAGLSQDDVRKRMRIGRSTLQEWEGGATAPPADKLRELCLLFGCSADEILALDDATGSLALEPGDFVIDEGKLQALEEAQSARQVDGILEDLLVFWFRVPDRYRVERSADAVIELERRAKAKFQSLLGGKRGGRS